MMSIRRPSGGDLRSKTAGLSVGSSSWWLIPMALSVRFKSHSRPGPTRLSHRTETTAMERSPSNKGFAGREPGNGQFHRMGHGLKLTLCAGCAAVAMVVSGAGYAAAAPVSFAEQRTAGAVVVPDSTRWEVSGDNSVDVTYDGTGFVYSVTFVQR